MFVKNILKPPGVKQIAVNDLWQNVMSYVTRPVVYYLPWVELFSNAIGADKVIILFGDERGYDNNDG